jgi:hypothetical protein
MRTAPTYDEFMGAMRASYDALRTELLEAIKGLRWELSADIETRLGPKRSDQTITVDRADLARITETLRNLLQESILEVEIPDEATWEWMREHEPLFWAVQELERFGARDAGEKSWERDANKPRFGPDAERGP